MIGHTFSFSSFLRKGGTMILALFWGAGLLLGSMLRIPTDDSFLLLMRSALVQPVSIVGLLSVLLVPFLISAFLACTRAVWLIVPIAFLKGICVGFCQALITSLFSSAGWLIYFFLMFSDIMTLPALLYFWIACLDSNQRFGKRLVLCLVYIVIIALTDSHLITPYLAALLI